MSPETRAAGDAAGELRARLSRELRDNLIEQAVTLPLGSQPALVRVAYLCQLHGATITEIARAAAADANFAATLLRIANSAASASRYPISDLPTAVTRLGTRMVGMLAVAAPTLRLLTTPQDELAVVRRELHRHSIRVGVVARELTPPSIHPETALAAGLVHNVGLGVLSIYAPVGLRRAGEAAYAAGTGLAEHELRALGFTHSELGGMLAREWRYPAFLVTAIEEHDSPQPSTPLAALVQVADLLVRESGCGIEPPVPLDPAVARMARLTSLEQARARVSWLLDLDVDGEADAEANGARRDEVSAVRLVRTFEALQLAS